MRIVAGSHRGRRLKSPSGRSVRPTPDRVREALFAILNDRVPGARVLDLYAGSGAVGLEALSRGAVWVHFAEQAAAAQMVIRQNVATLAVEAYTRISGGRLPGALKRITPAEAPFDLIFADPPYGRGHPEKLLDSEDLLALSTSDTLLIIELPQTEMPRDGLWQTVDRRRYGDTALQFLEPKDTV
jgi:16S rRNA (guanine966-N2)-methyltransferase